jgi:hypothetical protein
MSKDKGLWGAVSGALVASGLATTDNDETPLPEGPSATLAAATPTPTFGSAPVTLDAADQTAFESLRQRVYAVPSSYQTFAKFRDRLGNGTDLKTLFELLQAANPDVTPEKVKQDIRMHLEIIDTMTTEFEAGSAKDRVDNVEGKAHEIASLTAANEAAQREIAERTARITQLDAERQKADMTNTNVMAHFNAVKSQLTTPLTQAQALLGALA